jgi:hypothetical protein
MRCDAGGSRGSKAPEPACEAACQQTTSRSIVSLAGFRVLRLVGARGVNHSINGTLSLVAQASSLSGCSSKLSLSLSLSLSPSLPLSLSPSLSQNLGLRLACGLTAPLLQFCVAGDWEILPATIVPHACSSSYDMYPHMPCVPI